MAVKEAHLVPDGNSFRSADLNVGRGEWFEISIVVSRHDLYVRDYFYKTLKKFRNILPFLQLNFCNRVFHIAKKDKSSWMGVVDDLAELLQQTRDL